MHTVAINNESLPRRLLRQLRRKIRLLRWAAGTGMPSLGKNARLLLIYDLSSQPFSLGDLLVMQEAALIVREQEDLAKIDVAVIYEGSQPVVDDPAFREITGDSFLFHLSSILPAAQVNPFLGSAFLFDSHEALESFIADNEARYQVWPPANLYASREYLFYHCFNEFFLDYYARHKQLPAMRSRPAARSWARNFFHRHSGGQIMGTIQLRRNPANPARNSIYEVWFSFFRYCTDNYPVKFLIICAPHEVEPGLRDLPNVIVAKDHCTSLEQDLALIEEAAFHMGASSGPSTICQFNAKPYCIFGWPNNPKLLKGITVDQHRHRFYFSSEYQNWIAHHETLELLKLEFDRMWPAIKAGHS